MNENLLENEADAPEAPAAPAASTPAQPPAAPAFDPRRRIRELLSIPERDRSDAEWDELNELEIQTAPGNRIGGQAPFGYGGGGGGGGGKPGQGGGGGSKNRFKGKQRKPGGGGGAPGNRPPQQQGKPNKPPRPA